MTEVLPTDDLAIARQRGAEVLRDGLMLVAPTDTVYGVFADAFSMEATQRLLQARGAGRDHPLPVFVRSPRQLSGLVRYTSEQAERLIAAFWPGPLTIILEANDGLAWDLGDTAGTVAVRMPAEEIVYELVAEIGPLACTAASLVGQKPPRTVAAAREQLLDLPALYLDGGSRPGGASTVVDCSRGRAEVLRAGMISADDVHKVATGMTAWGDPTGPGSQLAAGAGLEPDGGPGDTATDGDPGDTMAMDASPDDTMAMDAGPDDTMAMDADPGDTVALEPEPDPGEAPRDGGGGS